MKRMMVVFIILTFFAALTGCAGMNRTQQTTLSGAAIGAVGGGLLGAAVGGSALAGATIGAAAGALGGYIVGEQGRGYYRAR
jgi:uncharacterized protein YcfJ